MLLEPNCSKRRCKYYIGVKMMIEADESSETHTCQAFPEGIPGDIAYGSNPHVEVHPEQDDQKGLTYKEKPKNQA